MQGLNFTATLVTMIIFDKVTKSFYPGDCGVFDLNFLIETGDAVVLTGKSGAGKTTIMKLLIREYQPESGEIYLDDQVYSQVGSDQTHFIRRKVGVVFQDFLLINELTAWENIALPLEVTGKSKSEIKKRVGDLIKLVGLKNKENLFPNQLSGGEAGRVGIARALALAPEVIFADEPTGNLDPKTSLDIAKILKKINQLGTTLILATHDPIIVDLFANDRIIKLENGRIVADSKPKDPNPILEKIKAKTKKKPGFFARLFHPDQSTPKQKTKKVDQPTDKANTKETKKAQSEKPKKKTKKKKENKKSK